MRTAIGWRLAMKSVLLAVLTLVFAVSSAASLGADDEAKDKAIKKDRKLYEGTWLVVSLTVDGNEFSVEDAKNQRQSTRNQATAATLAKSHAAFTKSRRTPAKSASARRTESVPPSSPPSQAVE
jgi:hypothetical protein